MRVLFALKNHALFDLKTAQLRMAELIFLVFHHQPDNRDCHYHAYKAYNNTYSKSDGMIQRWEITLCP